MNDLKILREYFRGHKVGVAFIVLAALGGAILGAVAYYQGWLG